MRMGRRCWEGGWRVAKRWGDGLSLFDGGDCGRCRDEGFGLSYRCGYNLRWGWVSGIELMA